MTRTMKSILGSVVNGADGELGRVTDVYFDDRRWTVRYLVVAPTDIDRSTPFLLSPIAVTGVREDGAIEASLSKEQAVKAPDVDEHQPVSRQMEQAFMDHYGWAYYWQGPELWGSWAAPIGLATPGPGARPRGALDPDAVTPLGGTELEGSSTEAANEQDSTLRSASEVGGYRVQAIDDEIGHVQDLLVHEQSWQIHCVVVDTRNWWFGKKVTVPARQFNRIDWSERKILVEATREQVKASSEYDEDHPACVHEAA
jgi:uncharacterized protein YrrD